MCSVICEANAAYVVWCTPNINTTYIYWENLVQKLKIDNLS